MNVSNELSFLFFYKVIYIIDNSKRSMIFRFLLCFRYSTINRSIYLQTRFIELNRLYEIMVLTIDKHDCNYGYTHEHTSLYRIAHFNSTYWKSIIFNFLFFSTTLTTWGTIGLFNIYLNRKNVKKNK